MKNKSSAYLSVLILFCLCSISFADLVDPTLVFKMTADKTVLLPSEETTVHVWAWIYDPNGNQLPHNGLDTWQMDLSVDNNGVIEILDLDVLAPNPSPSFPAYKSLNVPITGEAQRVAVTQLVGGAPSDTGVGDDNNIDNPDNYSEICRFTIRALEEPLTSTAAYTIMNDSGNGWFGILADTDGTLFDNDDLSAYGDTYFYAAGSDNVFTIVPEPATVVLFAIASVFALRRRKQY